MVEQRQAQGQGQAENDDVHTTDGLHDHGQENGRASERTIER